MTSPSIGTAIGEAIHLVDRLRSDQGPKHQTKPPEHATFANLLELSAPKDRARPFSETGLVQRTPAPHKAPAARNTTRAQDQNATAGASTAPMEGCVANTAPIQVAHQNTQTALHLASTASRIKKPHALVNCASTSAESGEIKVSRRHSLSDTDEAERARENAAPKPRNSTKTGDVLVHLQDAGVRVLIRAGAFDNAQVQRLHQHVDALLNAEGFTSASVAYVGPQNARPFWKRG